MLVFASIDWQSVFDVRVNLLELVFRGSLMYLGIFAALRIFRRAAGALGTADLLLVVLIADAAQNAMSANYGSLTEGAVLVATIIGWNVLLDWLEFRYEWARKILQPASVELVRNGRVNRRNLRSELMTLDELHRHLREHGIEDVKDVKRCNVEADGRLSVIKRDNEPTTKEEERSTR